MSERTPEDDKATAATEAAESAESAEEPSEETATSGDATGRPARKAAPAASAASRARRIGGRPLPGPRPAEETAEAPAKRAPAAAAKSDKQRVDTAKPAKGPRRRPAPARSQELDAMRRQLDRLRWVPAWITAAAVVVVLALGVWQSHGVWWGKRFTDTRNQQQQQVLATAKSCAASILSYDYRHLDDAQKAGLGCITGKFKDDYLKVIGFVRSSAPKLKAVQTLQIAKGGVQSVSDDGRQWVVLLYGQTVLTKGTDKPPTPRPAITTAVVTLNRVGDKWLVADMATGG